MGKNNRSKITNHNKTKITYNSHKEEKGMENFIINSILWTFDLYGLFELIKQIIYMCTYTNMKEDGIYIIIAVRNQEERIEGFLRSILFKILYGK